MGLKVSKIKAVALFQFIQEQMLRTQFGRQFVDDVNVLGPSRQETTRESAHSRSAHVNPDRLLRTRPLLRWRKIVAG